MRERRRKGGQRKKHNKNSLSLFIVSSTPSISVIVAASKSSRINVQHHFRKSLCFQALARCLCEVVHQVPEDEPLRLYMGCPFLHTNPLLALSCFPAKHLMTCSISLTLYTSMSRTNDRTRVPWTEPVCNAGRYREREN